MPGTAILAIAVFVVVLCGLFIYVTFREGGRTRGGPDAACEEGHRKDLLPVSELTHEEMHRQHREEKSEHLGWLEEIDRWRADDRRVLAMLEQLKSSLHRQEASLEEHAAAIRRHQDQLQRHERSIDDHEQAGESREHGQLAEAHERLATCHEEERALHRRFRDNHRQVLAELDRLSELLEAA
jgi:hypothetical protein